MKSSWIFPGPSKRKAEGDLRRTRRRESHVKVKAETKVMQPQAKDTWSHQQLEEVREDSPLGLAFRGRFDFRLWDSRTVRA